VKTGKSEETDKNYMRGVILDEKGNFRFVPRHPNRVNNSSTLASTAEDASYREGGAWTQTEKKFRLQHNARSHRMVDLWIKWHGNRKSPWTHSDRK